MKLPTKIRYAVRAVVELADRDDASPVPVKDISEAQRMSAKYVKQLMNRLQRAGLVKGYPGIHGGYTLAKDAGDISLYDIYQALDISLVLVPCVGTPPECDRIEVCSARMVWKRLHDSLEQTLKDTSVKELAKCERSLREGGKGSL
jgi:Rrf2 family protein